MAESERIPFLDLVTPHLELEEELTTIFRTALRGAAFVGGPAVSEFEQAFATFCQAEHCVGVANGTDAVLLALRAAGVCRDDVVLTVPNTFIATTEAISHAGAVPEFVDIDERTYNLDPAKLQTYLERDCARDSEGRPVSRRTGRRVTAIVAVHLYGQMADMDPILEVADRYRLIVIEDAAQAHGAEYFSRARNRWQRAGSMGRAAAFSFYPGKNLGACGEAGAVTTNDPVIAAEIRKLRDHGQSRKYVHEVEGYNSRLDAMQAGFLTAKLAHLPAWNERRRACAAEYARLFAGMRELIVPIEPERSRAVYHLYVVRVPDRDEVIADLGAAHIGTGLHYPVPLHLQEAYGSLGYTRGAFPVAEQVAEDLVSLPMYPQLRAEQQARVASVIAASLARRSRRRQAPHLS